MSNIPPDEDYNDHDQYYEDEPPVGSTRPVNPAQPSSQSSLPPASQPPANRARRPIPADDLPPVYARPQLSRRDEVRPQPPQEVRYPVAPPPPYYSQDDTRQGRRPDRQDRRARSQQKQKQMPRPQPQDRSRSGLYLPWWSLVIMLAFVACAAIGALAVVGTMESAMPAAGETPMIIVITSTYTVGPPASPTPIPQQATMTATRPLPTIPPTLTLPPGNFAVGELVTVVGVGESGLNIRSAPGVDSTIKFRAVDGDVFILREGPQQASNDEWWLIEAANDSTRSGWASRRYMAVTSQAVVTPTPSQ